MTSQRWTRIRPLISPFPHQLHPTFSPGPQQTECQVALPALPKVLPLIPLPPSTLLTHRHKHTQCAFIHANYILPIKPSIYAFIHRMVCLCEPFLLRHPPKKTSSVLLPPHVQILSSSHFSLIAPSNLLLFAITVNDSARAGNKGHIHTQYIAQMKCPFLATACSGVLLCSTGTINSVLPQPVQ